MSKLHKNARQSEVESHPPLGILAKALSLFIKDLSIKDDLLGVHM